MKNSKFFLIFALTLFLFLFSSLSFFVKISKKSFIEKDQKKLASIAPLPVKIGIENPEISAESYEIKRLKTGEILFSKNESVKRPIASLTKLISALVFIDSGGGEEEISISGEAKNTEEKLSNLASGERLLGKDILAVLLIESANDAARAIAEFTGMKFGAKDFSQSQEIFVALMNKKMEEIGVASTTHFANPAGLDDENNFSTARDISLMSEYINKNYSQVWDIARIYETSVFSESGSQYKLINTNILLKEFPAILGGKTGFTDEAKGALLILYALKPDEPILIVILGSEDRFGDGRKIINWLEEKYDALRI